MIDRAIGPPHSRLVTIDLLTARRGLILLVALFAFVTALVVTGYSDGFDRRIAALLALTADASPPGLILFMQGVSWVGGGTPRWVIVILLCGLVWHWCGPRCAIALGGASLLSNLASSLLKILFARARPDLTPHLDLQTSFSYPSGHATSAAAVYLLLAFLAPQRWRRAGWSVAGAMIVLNGSSRMMLGVHWASDILGGTLLGAAFALLGAWWIRERGEPQPPALRES